MPPNTIGVIWGTVLGPKTSNLQGCGGIVFGFIYFLVSDPDQDNKSFCCSLVFILSTHAQTPWKWFCTRWLCFVNECTLSIYSTVFWQTQIFKLTSTVISTVVNKLGGKKISLQCYHVQNVFTVVENDCCSYKNSCIKLFVTSGGAVQNLINCLNLSQRLLGL